MKICWDNLEGLRYSKRTNKWYKGNCTYLYYKNCSLCNEPYLSSVYSEYCGRSCSLSGKRHPMYGKKHTKETKKKMSTKQSKINNPNWKGGVEKKNLPLYETFGPQLELYEKTRKTNDKYPLLEVKCVYCGKWFLPKKSEVRRRIQSLLGQLNGECRLYCSDGCKQSCPIYWTQTRYKYQEINGTSREVQPELRKMVFERDGYRCVKCGEIEGLHCHHIEGIRWNPIESADIDSCITICKDCHKEIHQKEGCGYNDMKCI